MSLVHVVAVIKTKPGLRADVLALFNANVPAVLAEEGCIEYEATADTENAGPVQTSFGADTFVVIEKWASMEALGAHARSAHMRAYAASSKNMGVVAQIISNSERALPETEFRRCVRNLGGQVRSSG